jgi:hypothetical protein
MYNKLNSFDVREMEEGQKEARDDNSKKKQKLNT